MPAFRIREFQDADGPAVRALWTSVGFRLIADDDAGLRRYTERNPGLFRVAVSEDHGGHDARHAPEAVLGTCMGAWDGRRGWIYHVATDPAARGQGIATALIERVEAGLRAVGCERALVVVEESNAPALGFWQRRGYEMRPTRHLGKSL